MSDDASPSSTVRQRAHHADGENDDSADGRGNPAGSDGQEEGGDHGPGLGRPSVVRSQSMRKAARKRRKGLLKKLQFVCDLQRNLDTLFFAYVCAIYYMECYLGRMLIRLLPHYLFLTPKESLLLLPAYRPHVFAVFVPNILCILLHLVMEVPSAGEMTRGYLHGGVIVDFVGQKPPRWKSGLISFDIMILAIQCLMLAVHQEREGLRKVALPGLRISSGNEEEANAADGAATRQDHDAEERGVLRDDTAYEVDEDGGVEMRSLVREGAAREGGEAEDEDSAMLGTSYAQAAVGADLMDVMRSGNALLAHFHVVHAIRTIGNDYQGAAAHTLRNLGYTAALAAAMAADRRARLANQR